MSRARNITIRPVRRQDAQTWLCLRTALWPDGANEHAEEIAAFFAGRVIEPDAVLLAECDGACVALMELSLGRQLADLPGQKIAYVEGLYVAPEVRTAGVALRLLRAAQEWGRAHQCTAFASDRAGRVIVDRRYRLN